MSIKGGEKTACGKVFVCFVEMDEMRKGGEMRN